MIVFFLIKGGIIINKNFEKVDAPIIGADGNVFNLIGICQRSLKENGYQKEAKELGDRVTSSKSYDEALNMLTQLQNLESRLKIWKTMMMTILISIFKEILL